MTSAPPEGAPTAPTAPPTEGAPTAPETEGAYYSAADSIELMKLDLDFFSSVALPTECTEKFPPLHHNAWKLMTEAVLAGRELDQYAIGIPRGHAKTLLLKLLSLFIVLFTEKRFLLVVCNTVAGARNFLGDVCDLLSGENIITLFGDWRADIQVDNADLVRFTFQGRTIILKPFGNSGSVRGLNINFQRPDVIVCDDMQSLEESKSPEVAKNMLQWFLGTLLLARSRRTCTVIYLGNMYPDLVISPDVENPVYGCILRNLQLDPDWTSWVTGAVLADGTALWEAVISLASLLKDLRQAERMGQAEIWYAEVQNDPNASGSKYFDPSEIPEYCYNEFDVPIGKFLVIDPSLGKKKSDDQAVGLYYVYDGKGPVLQKLEIFQVSAPELVENVLRWALEEQVPLITAEAVAYQATLLQWFAFYVDKLGIEGIALQGVTPRGLSKASRILAYFKSLMTGKSKCHPSVLPLITAQAQFYRPEKANNVDDLLDVGAYGEAVYTQYSEYYMLPLEHVHSTMEVTLGADTRRNDHHEIAEASIASKINF